MKEKYSCLYLELNPGPVEYVLICFTTEKMFVMKAAFNTGNSFKVFVVCMLELYSVMKLIHHKS